MTIEINDKRRIAEIQEEFNAVFPYLKLEFFSKPHSRNGASSKKLIKHKDQPVFECRTTHNEGRLTVIPQMTVSDLEQVFMDIYGLSVQVFRKSGKAWLETTVTDGWTLEEQDKQGRELSTPVAD